MIPKLNDYKKRWQISSEDAVKPGLEAIREALTKMDNPESHLKVMHVAGTNGKGSTIAFMESILEQHGFTTGVFSSPAIIDLHDQIRMNGKPISKDELNTSFKRMSEVGVSGLLTDFELLTVAAFVTFERLAPDYVLLETGMGGILDSTNVVQPLVSVITSIALDHTAFLGTSIAEIAEQKAGIIKENTPVIVGHLPDEALRIIQQVAEVKESPLFIFGEQFSMENTLFSGLGSFNLPIRKMKGEHQGVNAAVAIESLLVAGILLTESGVANAVATTELQHRFQEIYPGVFLDGAHNPAAAKALANTIRSEFPGEKVDFIIGMVKGKDVKGTLDELIPVASSFEFLTFSHPDAATGFQLMKDCEFSGKNVTIIYNDTIILEKVKKRKTIVTGSLYLLATLNYQSAKELK